jgi:hypothetical protein
MDSERRLPLSGELYLDHVAHFVASREEAAAGLTRAGFSATPISIQTDGGKLTGTGNVTAMMTRGYVEVLFKTADTPLGQELDRGLAQYPGVHLIAFAAADARAESLRLKSAGFLTGPIVELRRPVTTQTGNAEAAFTVARVEAGQMAEGRIQILTHRTESAVWQPRWLNHPNGARGLLDVVVAVSDIGEAAARYVRFTDRNSRTSRLGQTVLLERGAVHLTDATTFARLVPGLAIPGLPFIGAYAIHTESLIATAQELRARGNTFEQRDRMLFAHFPKELGTGAWIFVERPGDLPWRA